MRAVLLLIFTLVMCAVSPVLASSEIMDVDEESSLSPLDGSGVIIAVADTGIDMDHSCFRNSTNEVGTPGIEHRKIVHLNDSIDDWDTQGHQQFKHGTHIAGIIAGDPEKGVPGICPLCKLIILKIVEDNDGIGKVTDSSILKALQYIYLINTKGLGQVRLINSSFGKFEHSKTL